MITVPLPPWVRRFQQTWYGQALIVFIAGFGGSLVLFGCFADGLFGMKLPCVKIAFDAYLVSLITAAIKGHTLGSTAFAIDGNPIPAAQAVKKFADTTVALKAKAADPDFPQVDQQIADKAAETLNLVGAVASEQAKIAEGHLNGAIR